MDSATETEMRIQELEYIVEILCEAAKINAYISWDNNLKINRWKLDGDFISDDDLEFEDDI